jgi:uncharacterized protein with beta-barrel porin domain
MFALTTLHVTESTDDNAGSSGNPGELRYRLNQMNTDLNIMPDDYAIVFDHPMTIQLNGILPIINNSSNPVNITIGNSGSIRTVTIDGNSGDYNGFFIPTGNVTIQNITFQNMTARGGNGGNGISGGGGGMGAGGAIYASQTFLDSSTPSVTLINVEMNNCSAIGGNGGSYIEGISGNEGGGGGGGFSGNGGSITAIGATGGGGGGGFGGNGGDATTTFDDPSGGGGGGGGGIGSRANTAMPGNRGNGGPDSDIGVAGSGYGLAITAGSGGGTYSGGSDAGGGGGGNAQGGAMFSGGGGGGSRGFDGQQPKGSLPPGGSASPSGGIGGDGGGGGGGGIVATDITNNVDGKAGSGGYGGGGGGGAGIGASDAGYTVDGGSGGLGGGGGGGGVNYSGMTSANGGDSQGGGGGGGGGPAEGSRGTDTGKLGGGNGGDGAPSYGSGFGGGGGGGGSAHGGAIFVDSGLNFTIQALSGTSTSFNTPNSVTQAGTGGTGGSGGGGDGADGSTLGESIFLRESSVLTLLAQDEGDLLIIGDGVSFVDDTSFVTSGSDIQVTGNGTVIYNGTSDYQGRISINNANFKVNGQINQASINVCRNIGISEQRGTLSGTGTLTGDVLANSGTISPDVGEPLTLGSLTLNSADPGNTLGSLVHIEIDANGTTSVYVDGTAHLAGILEIDLDSSAAAGSYAILTAAGGITDAFDSIAFTGAIPNYSLSYLPTYVLFNLLGRTDLLLSTQGLTGNNLRIANYLNLLSPNAATYGLTDQIALLNNLSPQAYQNALESISPSRNAISTFAAQNVMFMFSEALDSHFTKRRLGGRFNKNRHIKETALLADNELVAAAQSTRNTMYAPAKGTDSQIWAMGFGGFSHQDAQDQTPAFDFNDGGFFVAYDYGNTDLGCIGALAGYAHSSIHQHQSMGSGKLNSSYLSVYGTRSFSDFFLDAAIWGSYLSVDQKRKISYPGFNETAESSYSAEQLDLHFGTGYDFNINTGIIEPFALLDWVFERDPSYTENGAIPYNMKISSRTSWMLRFETGLNGYKTTTYNSGILIVQGKLSYVYKKPHNVGYLNATIAGAPGSFFVEAFTAEQNLISPAIELFWQTKWNGYASISYDGEFGSGYSSNQFYGKIGYSF